MPYRHFARDRDAMLFMGGRMRGPRSGGMGGVFGRGMGGGGRGFLRAGRMLADGDLRLIALHLIAESPRHGYDIIKALEERSSGFYSPSPGVVYPTLTFLEEAGYAVSAMEGSKKVFSITEAGRDYLQKNRALVDSVLDQMERFGRKMQRAREWFDWVDGKDMPDERLARQMERMREQFDWMENQDIPEKLKALKGARHRLRHAIAGILDASPEAQQKAIEILERAADELDALK